MTTTLNPPTKEQKKEERRRNQLPKSRSYSLHFGGKRVKGKGFEGGIDIPVSVKWTQDSMTFSTTLPTSNRKVVCKFQFGSDLVERRVHFLPPHLLNSSGFYHISTKFGSVVKDKKGKPITIQVALPSTTLTVAFPDGHKVVSRAICREMDVWSRQEGMKYALRHFLDGTGNDPYEARAKRRMELADYLMGDDYQALIKVCMTKPPSLGRIARGKKRKKEEVSV